MKKFSLRILFAFHSRQHTTLIFFLSSCSFCLSVKEKLDR